MAEIIDPYDGSVRETILAPTDGIVFFAHTEALISEKDIAYRLIHSCTNDEPLKKAGKIGLNLLFSAIVGKKL